MRKLSLSTPLALGLALAAGCAGADSHHGGMLVDPGPVPPNGMQIILPIQKGIKAGTDNELCTWTNVTADHDMLVKSVQGFQSETGHHVVVYKTKTYEPAGTTRPCTDDDMASFRFVAGAGGEGISLKNTAPGDLVFMIEKGYQIVVNEHFLNATPKDHDAQSAVNIEFADPKGKVIPSGALAVTDTKFTVPLGKAVLDNECTLQDNFKLWFAIPHMHEWGSQTLIEHIDAMGVSHTLFQTKWQPKYTFEPPELRRDPADPILLAKGDRIKVHCEWNNDSGQPLKFGPEMCVFFGQTIDDKGQGNHACDRGEWTGF